MSTRKVISSAVMVDEFWDSYELPYSSPLPAGISAYRQADIPDPTVVGMMVYCIDTKRIYITSATLKWEQLVS